MVHNMRFKYSDNNNYRNIDNGIIASILSYKPPQLIYIDSYDISPAIQTKSSFR
jgi:hypothetical protein